MEPMKIFAFADEASPMVDGQIAAMKLSLIHISMGVIVAAMALSLAVSAGLISTLLRHLKILLDKFDAFAVSGRPVLEEESPYRERRDEIGKLRCV